MFRCLIYLDILCNLQSKKRNDPTKSRTTILDANITTLIAAFILFFMGSGPVKGFSVTLGVGILTTLFSVYFIARLLTSLYVVKNKDKEQLL